MVWYLFATWFTSNFVLVFVNCVLLCAADFWCVKRRCSHANSFTCDCFNRTVKNVSGRLLVGLRWWSEVDDNGENKWFFECAEASFLVAAAVFDAVWLL